MLLCKPHHGRAFAHNDVVCERAVARGCHGVDVLSRTMMPCVDVPLHDDVMGTSAVKWQDPARRHVVAMVRLPISTVSAWLCRHTGRAIPPQMAKLASCRSDRGISRGYRQWRAGQTRGSGTGANDRRQSACRTLQRAWKAWAARSAAVRSPGHGRARNTLPRIPPAYHGKRPLHQTLCHTPAACHKSQLRRTPSRSPQACHGKRTGNRKPILRNGRSKPACPKYPSRWSVTRNKAYGFPSGQSRQPYMAVLPQAPILDVQLKPVWTVPTQTRHVLTQASWQGTFPRRLSHAKRQTLRQ